MLYIEGKLSFVKKHPAVGDKKPFLSVQIVGESSNGYTTTRELRIYGDNTSQFVQGEVVKISVKEQVWKGEVQFVGFC